MKAGAGILASAVLVIGIFGVYSNTIGSKNAAIPADLQFKAKFALFYPPKNSAVKVDKKTYKYDPSEGMLSFVSYGDNKTKLTISEQAAPEYLVAGNVAYANLVKSLPNLTSFDTANGKVSLSRSPDKNAGGFAFLSNKGTMLIVRSSKNLTDTQWKQIFNSFEAIKN